MDVLPEEKDKAKDLAVWHQVRFIPSPFSYPFITNHPPSFHIPLWEYSKGYKILVLELSTILGIDWLID